MNQRTLLLQCQMRVRHLLDELGEVSSFLQKMTDTPQPLDGTAAPSGATAEPVLAPPSGVGVFQKTVNKDSPSKPEPAAQLFEVPSTAVPARSDAVPYAQILANFNLTCVSLPKVSQLSPDRKAHIRQRYLEAGSPPDAFLSFFKEVERSDFLSGRAHTSTFRASFDWLMRPTNFVKVLEGNYANREQVGPSKHKALTHEEHAANEHQY